MNHLLGNYISTGINNPKKYPKEPHLSKDKQEAVKYTTDEEAERIARIKYGKKR